MLKRLFGIACLGGLSIAMIGCDVDQVEEGRMPDVDVSVDSGKLPEYDVEGPDVDLSMEDKKVTIPDVDVDTKETTIEVPNVDIDVPEE